jgi:ubiquinone/menaquinone biosynthesis C-methylase UbiE
VRSAAVRQRPEAGRTFHIDLLDTLAGTSAPQRALDPVQEFGTKRNASRAPQAMTEVSSTFPAFDAGCYDQQMGRWSRRLAPKFIDFSEIAAAERVLDVGCGTGSLSSALVENPRIATVHGIDFASAYIEHATRSNRESRVSFQVGDACDLPFPNGWFDHSLSLLVLQFIPDPIRAVREMRRVTRSGGTVAATTWYTRGGMIIQRMFFDTASVIDPIAADWRARTCARPVSLPHGLAQLWRHAGLIDVVQDSIAIQMDYSSFEDFWTSLAGTDGPYAAYLTTLTADARSRLRGLIQSAYLDGEPDGVRSYVATAWAVRGNVP